MIISFPKIQNILLNRTDFERHFPVLEEWLVYYFVTWRSNQIFRRSDSIPISSACFKIISRKSICLIEVLLVVDRRANQVEGLDDPPNFMIGYSLSKEPTSERGHPK